MSYGTKDPQNASVTGWKRKTVIDGPFTETKELIGGMGRPWDPGSAEYGRDRAQ